MGATFSRCTKPAAEWEFIRVCRIEGSLYCIEKQGKMREDMRFLVGR